MPIVRYNREENSKDPVVHCMKWGLVPSFTKKSEQRDHFRMFNARSESVHEKASFRRLLPQCRCLAIVEGFYEWKKDGAKKQPYYIHFKDERPLVFAALFDCWMDGAGEVLHTFTILTTRSSKALKWLHDRMPVILGSRESVDYWLNQDLSKFELQNVTCPYEASDLVWYPVNPAMGKTTFNGPECIKEIKLGVETKSSISQLFSKQSFAQPKSKTVGHNHQGTPERTNRDSELKISDGDVLNEEELKAYLAAMDPDEDMIESVKNEETSTKREVYFPETKRDIKDTIYPQITSAMSGGKRSKRKQPDEPSVDTKKNETSAKEKQRTMLNFFEKQ